MDQYNLPPQNIEAEKNVIGCCLLDLESRLYAVKKLSSDDFIRPQHKKIFDIIKKLQNSDKEVDMIIVNEQFNDINALSNICTDVITTAHSDRYVDIVKNLSIRRSFIKGCEKIIGSAYDADFESILEFKCDAMKELDIPIEDDDDDSGKINDILPGIIERMSNATEKDFQNLTRSGFIWLDKALGGIKPKYAIVAARPGVGKSTFVINMILNMVAKDKTAVMFNLEMTKEEIIEKMLAIISNVQNNSITNSWLLTDEHWQVISKNLNKIMDKNLYLFDNKYNIEQIRYKIRDLYKNGSVDFVCIDYLQLMGINGRFSGANEKVAALSRELKLIQKEFKTPVWVLSQLSRMSDKEKNRKPRLSDLRDSGAIEQDADIVLFLHNQNNGQYESSKSDGPEFLDLILAKQRGGVAGIETTLKFYKNTQKMYGWGD